MSALGKFCAWLVNERASTERAVVEAEEVHKTRPSSTDEERREEIEEMAGLAARIELLKEAGAELRKMIDAERTEDGDGVDALLGMADDDRTEEQKRRRKADDERWRARRERERAERGEPQDPEDA